MYINRLLLFFVIVVFSGAFLSPATVEAFDNNNVSVELQKAIDAYYKKNYDTAYNLILPLAEAGDDEAQRFMGLMAFKGRGVKANMDKGIAWWKKSAAQGNAKSMYSLGLRYGSGTGVKKDKKEGYQWMKRSAEAGYHGAMYIVALALHQGKYIEKDDNESLMWLHKAVNHGSIKAMALIGESFANGWLQPSDWGNGCQWYIRAAEHGDKNGQLGAGLCYFNEKSAWITPNPVEAQKWFLLSSRAGNKQAEGNVVILNQALGKEQNETAERLADAFNAKPWYGGSLASPVNISSGNQPQQNRGVKLEVLNGAWVGASGEEVIIDQVNRTLSIPFGAQIWHFSLEAEQVTGQKITIPARLTRVETSLPPGYPEVLAEADRASGAMQVKQFSGKTFTFLFNPGIAGAGFMSLTWPSGSPQLEKRMERRS